MPEPLTLKPMGTPTVPGDYQSKCADCGRQMIFADKRCILCTDCAKASSRQGECPSGTTSEPNLKGRIGKIGESPAPLTSKEDFTLANTIADRAVRNVCELPDYTSPDDRPELLQCEAAELHAAIIKAIEAVAPQLIHAHETPPQFSNPSGDRTPAQMREDAMLWSRASYPGVACGRYRDAADQIERLQREVIETEEERRRWEGTCRDGQNVIRALRAEIEQMRRASVERPPELCHDQFYSLLNEYRRALLYPVHTVAVKNQEDVDRARLAIIDAFRSRTTVETDTVLEDEILRLLDWAGTFKLAGGERAFAIAAEKLRDRRSVKTTRCHVDGFDCDATERCEDCPHVHGEKKTARTVAPGRLCNTHGNWNCSECCPPVTTEAAHKHVWVHDSGEKHWHCHTPGCNATKPYGKPCTCDEGVGRKCTIDSGERLGDLWYCRKAAEKANEKFPGVVAGSELEEQIRMARSVPGNCEHGVPRRFCTAIHGEKTECSLCASGMNSFTDPATGKKMHARNGVVTLCSAQNGEGSRNA